MWGGVGWGRLMKTKSHFWLLADTQGWGGRIWGCGRRNNWLESGEQEMLKPRPGCLCEVCLRWRTDRTPPFTQRIMAAADRVSARGRHSGLKLSRLKCKAGKPLSSILSHVPGINSPSHVSRGEQKISQSAEEADSRLVREVA